MLATQDFADARSQVRQNRSARPAPGDAPLQCDLGDFPAANKHRPASRTKPRTSLRNTD